MQDLKNYDCLYKYSKEYPECLDCRKNINCINYYPVIVSLGKIVIPRKDSKDELVRILKEYDNKHI